MINFKKYNNVTEIRIPSEITLSTTNFYNIFSNMRNLKTIIFPKDQIIDITNTFYNCTNLTSSPVCGNNVTNMCGTYYNCTNLTGFPVCGEKVTSMYDTYAYCTNLTGSPVCGEKVTNMYYTYWDCYNLTGSPVCGDNVVDMQSTYYNCTNLTGSPVCGNNVKYMSRTYCNCTNLTGSPVCGEKVTNMDDTYYNCTNLTGSPVCGNNVIGMDDTYYNCTNLTGSPVCENNVKYMVNTYNNCRNLTGNPVCGNNVTNMCQTYYNCTNLTGSPVCGEKVANMYYTYAYCTNLTGSPVCGPNVIDMCGTYQNCYSLIGSPTCGKNVKYFEKAYYNCRNLTGQSACENNVINMAYAYYSCINLTNAIIGQNVTNVESTYYNCSSLSDLTILAPYVKYCNTLTNVNTNLQIYVPEENLEQYIESEWGSHGTFMSENRNIYVLSSFDKILLFNEIQSCLLNFKKLNNNSSTITEISVTSEDETIVAISKVTVNENFISFDMQSFEKEGISTITIIYSDGIQTHSSVFQAHVFENTPNFTYTVEPIDGINYTFVLDANEEYYQNNTTEDVEDCAICKIVLNANGKQKLYIDYYGDFYSGNYGFISDLNETLELSNTEDNVYLKKVGWNKESGSIDYGIIPFGKHEIYIKYYKSHWIEWGAGLFKFKIRIENADI